MPLKSGSSKKVVSSNIKEMMKKYKKKGTIGTSKPASSKARESVELAGKLLNEENEVSPFWKEVRKAAMGPKGEKPKPKDLPRPKPPITSRSPKEGGPVLGPKGPFGKKKSRQDSSTEYYGTQLIEKLCAKGKAAAKRKFDVYPSAYANMYASAVCSGKVKPGGKKK
jgi:hypothetical protein